MNDLENYLKIIASNDKSNRLVDQGTGAKISLDPSTEFDGDNLTVDGKKVFHDGNCDSHNSAFGSKS